MTRMITLIGEDPEAHGVLDTPLEIRRQLPCEVASVGRAELYTAKSVGLDPSLVAVLPYAELYHGEKRCELCGVDYEIIRTYTRDFNTLELTLQAVRRNAAGGGANESV